MRMHSFAAALIGLVTTLSLVPTPVTAQARPWGVGQQRAQYDRGYRDGFRDGERDARQGRAFDFDNDRRLSRQRDEFQRGYAEGYRAGYEQFRGRARNNRSDRGFGGGFFGRDRGPRARYQDPAFARGYSDGYERGLDDGRDRDRYDPVRHRDYRDADDGYFRDYGQRQAYENNYRAGFRQGYEEGYRDGNRRR
jgi:flagellar biosynthesis/type III secretory pathway protein FliH